MSAPVISIAAGLPMVLRTPGDRLQLLEKLREESAEVVAEVFPQRGLKKFGRLKYPLSRARNGCRHNPLFRLAEWLIALRLAGVSFEVARLLLDWLSDLARLLLWPMQQRDPVALSLRTQTAIGVLLPFVGEYLEGERRRTTDFLRAARSLRAIVDDLVLSLQEEDLTRGLRMAA